MVRIGTCSWKYPSWEGLVYESAAPENWLAAYSRVYRTVEVDQWFWSLFGPDSVKLPDPTTVAEYAASVDPEFRFTIKAPNSVTLTHHYRTARTHANEPNPHFLSADLFAAFLDRLAPLRAQCDAIMLQFEYLNRDKMGSRSAFRDVLRPFLASIPDGWPIGIELRNPSWLTDEWFRFLAEHGVMHIFAEGYYLPPVVDLWQSFRDHLVPRTVVRLLGPDRKGIEEQSSKRWDRRLSPKDGDLRAIAAMTAEMLDRGMEVTVNVNNHYEGSAPRTIAVFRDFLEATRQTA